MEKPVSHSDLHVQTAPKHAKPQDLTTFYNKRKDILKGRYNIIDLPSRSAVELFTYYNDLLNSDAYIPEDVRDNLLAERAQLELSLPAGHMGTEERGQRVSVVVSADSTKQAWLPEEYELLQRCKQPSYDHCPIEKTLEVLRLYDLSTKALEFTRDTTKDPYIVSFIDQKLSEVLAEKLQLEDTLQQPMQITHQLRDVWKLGSSTSSPARASDTAKVEAQYYEERKNFLNNYEYFYHLSRNDSAMVAIFEGDVPVHVQSYTQDDNARQPLAIIYNIFKIVHNNAPCRYAFFHSLSGRMWAYKEKQFASRSKDGRGLGLLNVLSRQLNELFKSKILPGGDHIDHMEFYEAEDEGEIYDAKLLLADKKIMVTYTNCAIPGHCCSITTLMDE